MKNIKGFFENLVRKMGAQVNEMQLEYIVEENNQVEDEIQEVEKVLEEVKEVMDIVETLEKPEYECCECRECYCGAQPKTDGLDLELIESLVSMSLPQVLCELEMIAEALRNELTCEKCGGMYFLEFEEKDEIYYDLLELVGLDLLFGNGCTCNDEYKAEVPVTKWRLCGKKDTKTHGTLAKKFENNEFKVHQLNNDIDECVSCCSESDDKCNGCVDCKCHRNEEQEAMELYVKQVNEENALYTLNRPVEVIWACEEGVEPPTKNEEDMGFDVKAHFEEYEMVFKPHETKLVPTGLYAAVPTLWGLVAREKGSTGAIGMKCGAGVVDSGYRGEIFIAITNENDCELIITKNPDVKKAMRVPKNDRVVFDWNDNPVQEEVIFYPYKKGICQLLVKFNPKVNTKVVSIEELKAIPSIRGEGKLGSTDNF